MPTFADQNRDAHMKQLSTRHKRTLEAQKAQAERLDKYEQIGVQLVGHVRKLQLEIAALKADNAELRAAISRIETRTTS